MKATNTTTRPAKKENEGTDFGSLTSSNYTGPHPSHEPNGATLEVAEGGEHSVLRGPPEEGARSTPTPSRRIRRGRGRVRGRSHGSRLKMLRLLASIDEKVRGDHRVLFLTISYGRSCPTEPKTWTADLDSFRKRLGRSRFGPLPVIWSREFSRGGQVHHHLLIFTPVDSVAGAFVGWARKAWIEITGDASASHRRHGVHAEPLRSWRRASLYLAKLPDEAHQHRGEHGERLPTGRTWSGWNLGLLGITYRKFSIPPWAYGALRESFRKIAGQPAAARPGVDADLTGTQHVFLPETEILRILQSLGIGIP